MFAPLDTASDILFAALTRLSDLFAPTESWIKASLKRDPIFKSQKQKLKYQNLVNFTLITISIFHSAAVPQHDTQILFAKYNTIELNELTETGCRLWQNKVWFGGMFIYMIVVLAKNIIIVRKDVRSKDVYTKDQKDDNIAFQWL